MSATPTGPTPKDKLTQTLNRWSRELREAEITINRLSQRRALTKIYLGMLWGYLAGSFAGGYLDLPVFVVASLVLAAIVLGL